MILLHKSFLRRKSSLLYIFTVSDTFLKFRTQIVIVILFFLFFLSFFIFVRRLIKKKFFHFFYFYFEDRAINFYIF